MLVGQRLQLAVGALVLVLTVTLVVGLVAMGHRPLGRGFVMHVDFSYLENLNEGAEVRICALSVGRAGALSAF